MVFAIALSVAPWLLIPCAIAGLFAGGMLVDRPDDDRASRKRVAHRSGLLGLLVVAVTWSLFTDHDGLTRVLLALTLGTGAGVAVLGIVLIGMDARTLTRDPNPPGQER